MMQLFKVSLLLLLTMITCLAAADGITPSEIHPPEINPPVFVNAGNIYYTPQASHQAIQITNEGKDSKPLLSPDKKIIAFVRIGDQLIPKGCDAGGAETAYGNQIWVYDIPTKKERLLVANNFHCDEPKEQIIDPDDLTFSPNSKVLYFGTSAWTTSGAVHSVNVDGTNQRFVTDGSLVEVIHKGVHKGDLIVNQHRYHFDKQGNPLGSYNWDWRISPDGKKRTLWRNTGD